MIDSYQEILEKVKEAYDTLDLKDLSNDIEEGKNLISSINATSKYIYNIYGYAELNVNYIKIEKDVLDYINKIIKKYRFYIGLYNAEIKIKQQSGTKIANAVVCNIEAYVNILMILQHSKIIGKVIEEVFK